VYRSAVAMGAYGVVLIHNHPSGSVSPSASDQYITKRLKEAGDILNVQFLDHVIIGAGGGSPCFYSFREAGVI
jgi:DNA repair protein RadC